MIPTDVIGIVLDAYRQQYGEDLEYKSADAVEAGGKIGYLSRGKGHQGWKVFFVLDVPDGVSPGELLAEYYPEVDEVIFDMMI